MLDRLKAYLVTPEVKASRTAKLLAFENGGRARWTPRDYAALAREGYLGNAIVHRAVRLIAENAAACHFLVFDGAREIDAHPLQLLMTRPNPRQDGGALFEMLYAHLLLAGNAYVEAVAIDDSVRELYALRPDRMKVVPGADGWAEAYEYSVGGRSVRFDQQSSGVPPILHLTFFHPLDDHYGLAPIEAAATALDAAVQISVLDLNRTSPPAVPVEGERHVVASGAGGVWSGQGNAIATWQDGAWAYLAPGIGWCIWSVADNVIFVYDGSQWRDLRNLPVALDNAAHIGINTTAAAPNLLSVKSNAALFAAITAASGGSGDIRMQLSKETATRTASIYFADNFSGRNEFGLVGSDAFRLKVSADGSNWTDAFTIDQTSGNLSLSRGLALSGVIAPPAITANQNDYAPSGLASASVLQMSSDTTRSLSGLAASADGRLVCIINVGGQPITLLDESASSLAANRFTLGGNLAIGAKQAAILRYDGTATRWQAMSGGLTVRADAAQPLTAAQQNQGQKNLALAAMMRSYLAGLTLSTAGSSSTFGVAAGVAADSTNADVMSLGSAFVKSTAPWAAGSGTGALDAGTIAANTWYHVYLIKRLDTGAVDIAFSATSSPDSGPTLPTNYNLFRRIGSLKTNATGQWTKFFQFGDRFLWDVSVLDVNVSNLGTAATLYTLSTPPGVRTEALLRMSTYTASGNASVLITSPDESDQVTSGTNNDIYTSATGLDANLSRLTNQISQVRARSSVVNTGLALVTYGWNDLRGKTN